MNKSPDLPQQTITAFDMQRRPAAFQRAAMREPVTITSNGAPTLVVLSVDEYKKLQDRAQTKSVAGAGDEQGYTPIMERTRAIARLIENRDVLAKLGVAHVALYGSVARNTADELSDVDVVVDSADGKALGLFALARITEQLEQILDARWT